MTLRGFETNRIRLTAQLISLMAVGLFFFTAFVYELRHSVSPEAATSRMEIGWLPDYSGLPQP
jgi:hypothetical protein